MLKCIALTAMMTLPVPALAEEKPARECMLAGHHTVENLFLDLAGPRDHCYTHAYGYVKGVVDARDEVQFSLPDSGYNWFNLMQDFKVWYILEGEDHKYHLAAHGLTRALAQKFPIKEKDASTQSQEPSED